MDQPRDLMSLPLRPAPEWVLNEAEEENEEDEADEPEREEETMPPREPINSHIHAHNFVDGLALVRVSDLPAEERFCCICRTDYFHAHTVTTTEIYARMFPDRIDEESREKCVPVKLRCGHIVGDRCIRQWIESSLSRFLNGRCPVCRTVIERAPPQPNKSWDLVGMI